MICISLENQDPYFCLAAEEFLLKNYTGDVCMLWRSDGCVVVGKHQNALGEINYRYVRDNSIRVARRISGGGTVFHDRGNVNFTFIKNVSGPQEISFKRFTQPIVDVLASLGIEAVTSGRNDLLCGGFKISGNAEHIFKNRVLHHGTLLYNSRLDTLGKAISVVPGKYESRAVASNRSQVANISSFMDNPPPVETFIRQILEFLLKSSPDNQIFTLPAYEETAIMELSARKFETWDWNFGYSPPYRFSYTGLYKGKELSIQLETEKGKIVRLSLSGDCYTDPEKAFLVRACQGIRHEWHDLSELHSKLNTGYDDERVSCWF